MRKALLTLVLLQFCITSFAQKIRFTDNSNVWNILVTYHNSTTVFTQTATFVYGDTLTIDGNLYSTLGAYYVREDSAAKMVYIRYHDLNHGLVDSVDRVLYNYNLHQGDTVISNQFFGNYISWVSYIDSTKINNYYHKVWHFAGHKDTSSSYIFYNVIEGLGCTNMFDYPVNTPEPDGANQLVCFLNKGINPPLSQAVLSYGMFYLYSLEFNNIGNCPLGVEEINQNNTAATIFPNPVNENSKIVLPYTVSAGTLTVTNGVGQVISSSSFHEQQEVPIGDISLIPGIYIYQVRDINTGKVFSGKFAY